MFGYWFYINKFVKILKKDYMKNRILLVCFIVFSTLISNAQIENHVKWKFSTNKISDDVVELVFKATIDENWHLYSPYNSPGGSLPLEILYDKSDKFELSGQITEKPKPKEVYDDIFEKTESYFDKEATFKQKIKIKSDVDFTITGSLNGQTCLEDGMCVGFEEDFSFSIKGVAKDNIIENSEEKNIIKDTSETENDTLSKADINNKIDTNSSNISAKEIALNPDIALKDNKSLMMIFFISFLAGLLAILTPCVFPMIPMTVSFFIKEKNKRKGFFQALFYGLSIILIYTVIGTLVAILFGADFANFISTHWLPNILFFLIFMIFAASFLGMFEIILPNWIVAKADSQASKGGILGPFFMALTLVVVSFSCTGPIVGAILVQSAGGAILEPIIGMFGFSLAFALPFFLFAFFPSKLNALPKSGGWLNTVKVVLGFIEIALGFKFLSVADQTYHWGILDREIYIAIWIVTFSLMGLYLLGKLKFAHDSEFNHIKVPRLGLAMVTFTFVVYLIPGMFGAPLKALSGYLPPQSTHDFDLVQMIRENSSSSQIETVTETTLCEKPKYSEFLHLPHGLEGYFDYEQGLKCAKELNKPVFIDFTGHGCVNCREMEANVWADPKVLKRLKENFIIIALYVDDKTSLPENEWYISDYDGKTKKTIGKKYADLQISKYNVNAQPYYVLLDTNGEKLIEPRAYDLDIEEFIQFLDNGVIEFNKRTSQDTLSVK